MEVITKTYEKRDWEALRMDYLIGDYLTLTDFARKHNIEPKTLLYHGQDWDRLRQIARSGDEVTVMNKAHLRLSKKVLERFREYAKTHKIKTWKHALDALQLGVKIERDIRLPKGVDTQIHVTLAVPLPRPGGRFLNAIDVIVPVADKEEQAISQGVEVDNRQEIEKGKEATSMIEAGEI